MDKQEIKDFIAVNLASFNRDPPDNDFQKGYKAALETIWHECFNMPKSHPAFSDK